MRPSTTAQSRASVGGACERQPAAELGAARLARRARRSAAAPTSIQALVTTDIVSIDQPSVCTPVLLHQRQERDQPGERAGHVGAGDRREAVADREHRRPAGGPQLQHHRAAQHR